MSLWGNSDNVTSAGTVWLDYATGIVTGSASPATAFGAVGSAQTGDVIRFGTRGGGEHFYGDAQIVGITSARQLTIGSTGGLSGAAIAGTNFYVSELPSYTVGDHAYSNKHDTVSTYKTLVVGTATSTTAIGATSIGVDYNALSPTPAAGGSGHDALVNDGNNNLISSVGTAVVTADATSAVGISTVYVVAPEGIVPGDSVDCEVGGIDVSATILTIDRNLARVGLADTISAAITDGDSVTFNGNVISVAALTAQVTSGDTLTFVRKSGGYDKIIYGVSVADSQAYDGSTGKYRTSGSGWVGVTTYTDCDGNFRVKSEILVAMGPNKDNGNTGITTGANGIGYPTNKG